MSVFYASYPFFRKLYKRLSMVFGTVKMYMKEECRNLKISLKTNELWLNLTIGRTVVTLNFEKQAKRVRQLFLVLATTYLISRKKHGLLLIQ